MDKSSIKEKKYGKNLEFWIQVVSKCFEFWFSFKEPQIASDEQCIRNVVYARKSRTPDRRHTLRKKMFLLH